MHGGRIARAVAVAAGALAVAGCGGADSVGLTPATGDSARGKELYTQKCAGCHTLEDAKARGVSGPNLDDAFGYARKQGFKDTTIREVVRDQITYAADPMPNITELFPKCKEGEKEPKCSEDPSGDADDVAAYVAAVAGKRIAGGGVPASEPDSDSEPEADPKELFISNCGGCHTLDDAGTNAAVGPSLDDTDLDFSAILEKIREGGGGMPSFKDQIGDAQIEQIARYVSEKKGS